VAKQTVTLRLDGDDLTFLAQAEIADAANLSEKIRALISDARMRREGTGEYTAAHDFSRQLFSRVERALNSAEIRAGSRSELTHRVLAWLPEATAFALSACQGLETDDDPASRLRSLEAGMAERALGFVDSMLQLAMAEFIGCHDPRGLANRARFAVKSTQSKDRNEAAGQ